MQLTKLYDLIIYRLKLDIWKYKDYFERKKNS